MYQVIRKILIACFCIGFLSINGQTFRGLPRIETFSPDEYRAGIQNWKIGQDSLGLIYVANNLGVLVYDGTSWNLVPVALGKKLRSLDISNEGVIYVGGENEFGFLEPDSTGQLGFVSLRNVLPENQRDFADIWRVHAIENRIFFQGFETVFLYENEEVKRIQQAGNYSYSFTYNEGLLLADYQNGLIYYGRDEWTQFISSGRFKNYEISSVVPFEGNLLIGAVYEGLFTLSGDGTIERWITEIDEQIGFHHTDQVLVLSNGDIAVGTRNNGLFVINSDGRIIHHFTQGRGLPSRAILDVFEDAEGSLWIGLNNGIAKIHLSSPFSYINEQIGVKGSGYQAIKKNDQLFLSARNGLFSMKADKVNQSARLIGDLEIQAYSVSEVNGDLLLGGHAGAYQINSSDANLISEIDGWWKFESVPESNDLILGGTYGGLYILEKSNGKYRVRNKVEGYAESSRLFLFEDSRTVWSSHGYKGAYRIHLSEDLKSAEKVEHYGEENGFPSNVHINVFKIADQILFSAERGVYVFNRNTNAMEPFEPFDNAFGKEYAIMHMDEDILGNVYLIGREQAGVLRRKFDGSYLVDFTLFKGLQNILNDDLFNVQVVDERNVLFGAKEGFVHFDPTFTKEITTSVPVYVKSFSLIGETDSLISDFYEINKGSWDLNPLPFKHNSVKISYTSPFYSEEVEYSVKLEGLNKSWSDWSSNTSRNYLNLREGSYTFFIKARNLSGIESRIQSISFTVLPPWYRTTWFRIMTWLILSGGLISLFLFQNQKHKTEKRIMVTQQKRELLNKDHRIRQVTEESQAEIDKLVQENMETELAHKSQQLATSTMNIIQKNELMNRIKGELKGIKGRIKDEESIQNLGKIIRNIDRSTHRENDWEQFQISFDQVHGDFSKRFKEAFPSITPQELKLCAYLRLNMSTKEISNLLNISVRAVETNRYRLRKKLNIDRSDNLTDFILSF